MTETSSQVETYSHEAFFYADGDEYLSRAVPFVEAGLESGEAVLLALPERKRELMRWVLDDRAEQVHFMAMEEVGRNPARLIAFCRDFLREDGRLASGARGLGEPVYPGRSAAEIEEAEQHERLVNLAFGSLDRLTFLCAYDSAGLDDDVLSAAESSHDRERVTGDELGGALPKPGAPAATLHFGVSDLREVRRLASEQAELAGFGEQRSADLVLALSEVATPQRPPRRRRGRPRDLERGRRPRLRGPRHGHDRRPAGRPPATLFEPDRRPRPLDRQPAHRPPPDQVGQGGHPGALADGDQWLRRTTT